MSAFKVCVYFSVAYQGMEEEREILTQHVFPEIHHRCQARGVDFVALDLRHEQRLHSDFISKIDLNHSYFLVLLANNSRTNLDFFYDKNSLFYIRDDNLFDNQSFFIKRENTLSSFSNPHVFDTLPAPYEDRKRLYLIEQLHAHSCPLTEYEQAIDLQNILLEQLWTQIKPDFLTAQEREDFEHDALAASLQSFYIKQPADFARLTEHALSDSPPLVIVGESGSGKSALLANWGLEYRQAHPDEFVFWHFCQADPFALLRRLMKAIKSHFLMDDDLPNTPEALIEQFPQYLAQGRMILIIEGFNQSWLPDFLPAHIRLFLSILPEKLPLEMGFKTVSWRIQVPDSFISHYIQQYGLQNLQTTPATNNPLYLKIILDEYRRVDQDMAHYWEAQSIPALYEKMLARLELDYSQDWVEKVLSLFWAAQWGLRESEILAILDIPQAIWFPLSQRVLVNRAGLLHFFHETLQQAVQARYLFNDAKKRAVHRQLADYFVQQPLSSRIANESLYHLKQAREPLRLHSYISQIAIFLQLLKDGKEYELWHYWDWLGIDLIVDAALLEQTVLKDESLLEVLEKLATFLKNCGFYSSALALFRRALKMRQKLFGVEHPDILPSLNHLAFLLKKKGDYESAKQFYRLALKISQQVLGEDHADTATFLNHLALVLQGLGAYEEAEPLYRQALKIRENVLGVTHSLTLQSFNHLALLLQDKGDYEEAEQLYRKTLSNCKGCEMATALNNLALLLKNKGDSEGAKRLYQRALVIFENVLGATHANTVTVRQNLELL